VASSACGFAALTLALDDLFEWHLPEHKLSILARQGSGSACRSLRHGFMHWQQGELADGSDSFATPLNITWPELRIGLHILTTDEKPVSSRVAMEQTVQTSKLYEQWPMQVETDLAQLQTALASKDFAALGEALERNATAMHATMADATPPTHYDLTDSTALKKQIQALRETGIDMYFTQDAGPNIKGVFLAKDTQTLQTYFPAMLIINPFENRPL
jgi:diphosphomevalonate decarboxylase